MEVYTPPQKASSLKPGIVSIVEMGFISFCLIAYFLIERAFRRMSIQRVNRHIHNWALCFIKVSRTALKRIDPAPYPSASPVIYMINHRSLFDIPAVLCALPSPVRMIAKEELTHIPCFGKALVEAGFVPINRKNLQNAIQQMDIAKQRVNEGISICIFPEGTRSKDTNLLPFKKGGFHLAIDLGIPIVPVWLEGSEKVIPSRQIKIVHNQTVTLYRGEPIPTQHLNKSHIPELMTEVREKMLELRPTL